MNHRITLRCNESHNNIHEVETRTSWYYPVFSYDCDISDQRTTVKDFPLLWVNREDSLVLKRAIEIKLKRQDSMTLSNLRVVS